MLKEDKLELGKTAFLSGRDKDRHVPVPVVDEKTVYPLRRDLPPSRKTYSAVGPTSRKSLGSSGPVVGSTTPDGRPKPSDVRLYDPRDSGPHEDGARVGRGGDLRTGSDTRRPARPVGTLGRPVDKRVIVSHGTRTRGKDGTPDGGRTGREVPIPPGPVTSWRRVGTGLWND